MRATPLDESVFDDLVSTSGEDLISVFLPTHKTGRDVAQDRIRLKNRLSEIDGALEKLGWKPRQRAERLARAHELLDDHEFWEHQEAGLAVYIDDGGEVVPISTTRPVVAAATVMPVFMLRPLAADLHALRIPVLALTQDEVSLFTANQFGVGEIPAELPAYEDVNWFVDREKERQQHPDMVGTDRSRHGHEPSARRDEDLARFLREVDSALSAFQQEAPLVVLGDDDVVARFAQVSQRATVSRPNSGVRAPVSADEILDKVASLIGDLDRERIEDVKATARDQLGMGMATTDVEEAVSASFGGRVGRILVFRTAPPIWGRFDEVSLHIDTHEHQEPGDVDLLDRLVVWSRMNGAEIVATEELIDDRPFIATFRY